MDVLLLKLADWLYGVVVRRGERRGREAANNLLLEAHRDQAHRLADVAESQRSLAATEERALGVHEAERQDRLRREAHEEARARSGAEADAAPFYVIGSPRAGDRKLEIRFCKKPGPPILDANVRVRDPQSGRMWGPFHSNPRRLRDVESGTAQWAAADLPDRWEGLEGWLRWQTLGYYFESPLQFTREPAAERAFTTDLHVMRVMAPVPRTGEVAALSSPGTNLSLRQHFLDEVQDRRLARSTNPAEQTVRDGRAMRAVIVEIWLCPARQTLEARFQYFNRYTSRELEEVIAGGDWEELDNRCQAWFDGLRDPAHPYPASDFPPAFDAAIAAAREATKE